MFPRVCPELMLQSCYEDKFTSHGHYIRFEQGLIFVGSNEIVLYTRCGLLEYKTQYHLVLQRSTERDGKNDIEI